MPSESTAFRSYSKAFDTQKGVQGFTHLWDNSWEWVNGSNVVQTGAWRPLLATDFSTSISGVTVNTTALETIATSGVAFQAAVSGQTATLVTEATNRWKKVSSSGYVSSFSPTVGSHLVSKVQGISKTTVNPGYILVYDGATGAGNYPVASVAVSQNNNWFIDFAEAGVQFNDTLTLVNSSDGVTPVQYGTPDFFATVVYK
jgi:hypothetical protein